MPARVVQLLRQGGFDFSILDDAQVLVAADGSEWARFPFNQDTTARPASGYGWSSLYFLHATHEQALVAIARELRLRPGPSTLPGRFVHGLGWLSTWNEGWENSWNAQEARRVLPNIRESSKHASGVLAEIHMQGEHKSTTAFYEASTVAPNVFVSTPNCHKKGTKKYAVHETNAVLTGWVVELRPWRW